ncbi:MAG: hypothetical protein ACRENC_15470, partial [Gemmatimonadaceae bacterium]
MQMVEATFTQHDLGAKARQFAAGGRWSASIAGTAHKPAMPDMKRGMGYGVKEHRVRAVGNCVNEPVAPAVRHGLTIRDHRRRLRHPRHHVIGARHELQ